MKIEIDFARPDELRKMKRELENALATVDAALVAIGRNQVEQSGQMPLAVVPDPPPSKTEQGSSIASILARHPAEFDMKTLLQSASEAKIPSSKMRREITRLVEAGTLVLVQKGKGRRPSIFRKV